MKIFNPQECKTTPRADMFLPDFLKYFGVFLDALLPVRLLQGPCPRGPYPFCTPQPQGAAWDVNATPPSTHTPSHPHKYAGPIHSNRHALRMAGAGGRRGVEVAEMQGCWESYLTGLRR